MLSLLAAAQVGLEARRFVRTPIIDGRIGAAEWSDATRVTDFWYVAEQKPSPYSTICIMAYDDANVYFAFECADPDPEGIRKREMRTNAVTAADDVVAVGIDPSGRRRDPYWFYVNAAGTQRFDAPSQSGDPNLQWQGQWEAAAAVTNTGWTVEIRIPAAMLRPPRGQESFGLIFVRIMPRTQHFYTYPRMPALPMDESNSVPWRGLNIAALRYAPIIKPYLKYDTANGGSTYSGLDARYVGESGVTGLLTIKPDFDDIARDVEGINFTYTERYLRETRSFFLEGAGLFPRDAVFYSPRLHIVGAGLKSFGSLGALQYGGLAVKNGEDYSGAARLNYQFSGRSFVYLDTVATTSPGYSNTVTGIGARSSRALPDGEIGLAGFVYGSHDNEADGRYATIEAYRNAANARPSFVVGYEDISPDFFPAIGFLPEVGFRSVYGSVALQKSYETGAWYSVGGEIGATDRVRYGGGTLDSLLYASAYGTLRNELALRVGSLFRRRPPFRDKVHNVAVQWNSLQPQTSGMVFYYFGSQHGGDSDFYGFEQNLRLARAVSLSVLYAHIELRYPPVRGIPDYVASQLIGTLRYDISPTSGVAGRYVGEGRHLNSLSDVDNFYFSCWQRVRKGADIFLIWGLPNAERFTDRFAVKMQMPFELGR